MDRVTAFCAGVAALLLLLLPPPPSGDAAVAPAAAAKIGPGSRCTRWCGNISIPYPFGVEPGCYHARAAGFNLTCDRSHRPPKLFLGDGTVQVLEISVANATVRISSRRMELDSYVAGSSRTVNKAWGRGLPRGGPFVLSEERNKLQVESCNVQVDVRGAEGNSLIASCAAICPDLKFGPGDEHGILIGDGSCAGIRCCQANIDIGYSFYNIQIRKLEESINETFEKNSVYIVDRGFHYIDTAGATPPEAVPATLKWAIVSNSACPTNESAPECRSAHSSCLDLAEAWSTPGLGYVCQCCPGYQGNPYIHGGCQDIYECSSPESYHCYGYCKNTQGSFICKCHAGYVGNASVPNGCIDIDECENPTANSCHGICLNFPGSFHCQCPNGTYGDPSIKGGCIIIKNSFTGLSIGLGVGGGASLLLVALGAPYIIRKIKLRKVKKMRAKFFNQNRGLLLQQLISQNADIGERMIVTLRELKKATHNFDRSRVIGGGGHGVVFKGIVDLNVVAIKKSKIVVQREINEFINEVVILSQVNHRNVVKLLGCCLETEVPLLVYEFISNGTLYQHLHVEGPISLSWVDRIRIALEVARALSYLHSAASIPVFHRDIKSSNVLLDDSLTAKVSDFGASRYIPMDQTGVTTVVQGTLGYLDPMYYYTGRLTDKSDVFSFGVLLVELLTRKQPFIYRSNDGNNLVSHFGKLLTTSNLVGIIDPQVMEEEDGEVQDIAALAAICTKLRGEDRPKMREVEMTLENLLVRKKLIPCITIPKKNDEDETLAQYMSTEPLTNQASRQHTMEEEIMLSASYPR